MEMWIHIMMKKCVGKIMSVLITNIITKAKSLFLLFLFNTFFKVNLFLL